MRLTTGRPRRGNNSIGESDVPVFAVKWFGLGAEPVDGFELALMVFEHVVKLQRDADSAALISRSLGGGRCLLDEASEQSDVLIITGCLAMLMPLKTVVYSAGFSSPSWSKSQSLRCPELTRRDQG